MGPSSRSEGEATVTIPSTPDADGSVGVARLVVVYPRALAGVHPIGEASVTLGRTAGAAGSLVVAHPTVSRRHATLTWNGALGSHSLVDLGSHNGTWVEGSPVVDMPRYLVDQAVVRFGDVLAVYERSAGSLADAPEVAVLGGSLAACSLRAAIARAGVDPSPVLVEGETGAGKERIAAELHRLSGRRGPLVVVNCAALSASVIESQLFGHVRGAFTGATHEHPGLFRAAAGGTLFLDEIGELPLELQPKLLRAVELGEVTAVGSTQRQQVDVRVVAATNRSLSADVARGKFRRDLHARLSLWQIEVPPLRARRADLLDWLDRLHSAWSAARGQQTAPPELQTDAALTLLVHPWPDNLRGLQRVVHRCAATGERAPISRAEVVRWLTQAEGRSEPPAAVVPSTSTPAPPEPAAATPPAEPRPRRLRTRPTREALVATLEQHGWSIRAAAKHYACERKQIKGWLEMYAIVVQPRDDDDA